MTSQRPTKRVLLKVVVTVPAGQNDRVTEGIVQATLDRRNPEWKAAVDVQASQASFRQVRRTFNAT